MGTVETFDHTADVGLRVTGDDLRDLFVTAAEGVMGYVVANREDVRVVAWDAFALDAESTQDLLLAWLGELIFRSETGHTLYSTFEVDLAPDACSLHARIGGEPIDRDRHVLDHEVKAVTRHGLVLRPGDGEGAGWVAEMILDI